MGLREENRRRTTELIVETAGDLVRRSGTGDFTMPEVAAASGVSLRTLYRYFATRDALVAEVARLADQTEALDPPGSLEDLESWLRRAWEGLLREEALLRAQHDSASGREIRRSRVDLHRQVTGDLLSRLAPGLPDTRRADVVDAVLLVCSSTALFEYLDVLEVDVDRAARISARLVRALLEYDDG